MSRRVIDVSALPVGTADSRSLIWWGNLAMMTIEGTMFAMLIATYLYLRVANLDWPPSTVRRPDLALPLVDLAILVLTALIMVAADRGARRARLGLVQLCFAIGVVAGIAFLAIRWDNLAWIGFRWSDHAYGSIVWTMIGFHSFHMIAAVGETALLLFYSFVRPVTKKQVLDFRCTAVYWYFVAITWIPLFALIYVAPWLGRKVRM